jgi:hypothetical protein
LHEADLYLPLDIHLGAKGLIIVERIKTRSGRKGRALGDYEGVPITEGASVALVDAGAFVREGNEVKGGMVADFDKIEGIFYMEDSKAGTISFGGAKVVAWGTIGVEHFNEVFYKGGVGFIKIREEVGNLGKMKIVEVGGGLLGSDLLEKKGEAENEMFGRKGVR